MTEFDNDMSRAKRAGDQRRVLTGLLHHYNRDMAALGLVIAEARECGRAHHLTFALWEALEKAYHLGEDPTMPDQIAALIAQFTLIEEGTEDEEND